MSENQKSPSLQQHLAPPFPRTWSLATSGLSSKDRTKPRREETATVHEHRPALTLEQLEQLCAYIENHFLLPFLARRARNPADWVPDLPRPLSLSAAHLQILEDNKLVRDTP